MDGQIENKFTGVGQPDAIFKYDRPLDNRQLRVLDELPEAGSRATFGKDDVSMFDLSALTAKTGDEFAMFTRGGERLVVRGDERSVNVDRMSAAKLSALGYKWSGHTHPGDSRSVLMASRGDKAVLNAFNQETSVVYNSIGNFQTFTGRDFGG